MEEEESEYWGPINKFILIKYKFLINFLFVFTTLLLQRWLNFFDQEKGITLILVGLIWIQTAWHSLIIFPNSLEIDQMKHYTLPGRVAQSVTCLATYASLTADPGVASSILARSHTFVEIDHGIISTVTLLPSAESFKKGCCQLQAKVCAQSTG